MLFLSTPGVAEELDLTGMSIEALMDVKVTSVTKKVQHLSDSAAAIFVITNEDLRRFGVTTIPDALRMVPGLNVARIDSNKWAVNGVINIITRSAADTQGGMVSLGGGSY